MHLLALARALVPRKVKSALFSLRERLFDPHSIKSYSQEGEDVILRRIFDTRAPGFYVDVGAHHPHRFSNTNYFYQCGWQGINVEPNPDAVRAFKAFRRRDINVQCGISDAEGRMTYYKFNDPALNTFDEALMEDRLRNTPYKLVGQIEVPVRRLDGLFDEVLPPGQAIAFMSIDVEGLDLRVLRSNDWSKYRPRIVLAEAIATTLENIERNDVAGYMRSQGYQVFGKTLNTWIFKDGSVL